MIRPFCWHQNFVPWGLFAPVPGLYTCIKSWKKIEWNQTSNRFFWNLQQMNEVTRHFCWHQNFAPGGCLPLSWGYTHVWNHEKKLYKIRLQRDFFLNLQQITEVTRCSCCIKISFWRVVSPCLWAIYMYKIMEKMYKIRLQRDFLKLVANDRSDKRFLLTSKFCPLGLSAPDLR